MKCKFFLQLQLNIVMCLVFWCRSYLYIVPLASSYSGMIKIFFVFCEITIIAVSLKSQCKTETNMWVTILLSFMKSVLWSSWYNLLKCPDKRKLKYLKRDQIESEGNHLLLQVIFMILIAHLKMYISKALKGHWYGCRKFYKYKSICEKDSGLKIKGKKTIYFIFPFYICYKKEETLLKQWKQVRLHF